MEKIISGVLTVVMTTTLAQPVFAEELNLRLGNNFFPFQCDLSDFDTAKSLLTYIEEKQFQVEVLGRNLVYNLFYIFVG